MERSPITELSTGRFMIGWAVPRATPIGGATDTRTRLFADDGALIADSRMLGGPGGLVEIAAIHVGVKVLDQAFSVGAAPVPNTAGHPAGIFSIFDTKPSGLALVIGTGVGYPLDIDRVRVWQ